MPNRPYTVKVGNQDVHLVEQTNKGVITMSPVAGDAHAFTTFDREVFDEWCAALDSAGARYLTE